MKKRSPKYPFIHLARALERTEVLYDQESVHPAALKVVVAHWGYKEKSSGGLQTVAALVGYGLLETVGTGASRTVKVTDFGRRILLDNREDSTEKLGLIRKAALNPPIFEKLWQKWRYDSMPSPANMRHMLVFSYDFNENTVNDFVKVLTQTFKFAGLIDENNQIKELPIEGSISPISSQEQSDSKSETEVVHRNRTRPPVGDGMQEATFPLPEGLAVLQWPSVLSKDSYDDLKAWTELALKGAERSIVDTIAAAFDEPTD